MNRMKSMIVTLAATLALGLGATATHAATLYFDADRDPSNGQTPITKQLEEQVEDTADGNFDAHDGFFAFTGTDSFWYDAPSGGNQVDWQAGSIAHIAWTRRDTPGGSTGNNNVKFLVTQDVEIGGIEVVDPDDDPGVRSLSFAVPDADKFFPSTATLTGDVVIRVTPDHGSFGFSRGPILGGTPNSVTIEGGSIFDMNGSNDDHTFKGPVTVTGGSTVVLRDASGFGPLDLGDTDPDLPNTVTLDDAVWEQDGNSGSDGQFFPHPIKIGNGGATFVPKSNNALMRFTGTISDASTGDLTIDGSGASLAFGGDAGNTHSGNTIVTAGTLLLDKPDDTDAIAGDVLIQDGGVLALLENNQVNDGSIVEVEAGGVLDLNYVGDVVQGPGSNGKFNKGGSDDVVSTGDQGTFDDFIAELILNSDNGTYGVVDTGDGGVLSTLAFSIDGTGFGVGTYTASDGTVNGFDMDNFIDGTGSIEVIPEPASLALLGLGSLLIAGRRRRA